MQQYDSVLSADRFRKVLSKTYILFNDVQPFRGYYIHRGFYMP